TRARASGAWWCIDRSLRAERSDDVRAGTTATVAWMRERIRASPATPSGSPVQVRASSEGSELIWQVPVDLEADADLNEGRGAPGHGSTVLSWPPAAPPPYRNVKDGLKRKGRRAWRNCHAA